MQVDSCAIVQADPNSDSRRHLQPLLCVLGSMFSTPCIFRAICTSVKVVKVVIDGHIPDGNRNA